MNLDVRRLQLEPVSDVDIIRTILRALADVRDGPFYRLWVDLTYAVQSPQPEIGFRLRRVADSAEVSATVWVSARNSGGTDVGWGISVDTIAEHLVVSASISLTTDTGEQEVYSVQERTPCAAAAAATVVNFSHTVCSQRQWMDPDESGMP
mgnify:CR=1 FL=1